MLKTQNLVIGRSSHLRSEVRRLGSPSLTMTRVQVHACSDLKKGTAQSFVVVGFMAMFVAVVYVVLFAVVLVVSVMLRAHASLLC